MATPNNILTQVQTYQKNELAFLLNRYVFINKANKRYQNFQNLTANLGQTVTFDLPPRFTFTNSLVAQWEPAVQRVFNLTVDGQGSISYAFTNQNYLYNDIPTYMERFGKGAMAEMGARIEQDVAKVCETSPYRFYGDGVTQINTFGQIAKALALFRNYGASNLDTMCILSDIAVPDIVNSGLGQFAMDRNNEAAMSWMVARFSECDFMQSNLLPVHVAGTEGNQASVLTVVATTLDANGAVIAIEFSGTNAANDTNSIKQYDRIQFQDAVSGQPNMRFLHFIGHTPSDNPVQFMATANATSSNANHVTISITPPLQVQATQDQNINNPIVPGMQVKVLPSHRAGLIMSGQQFFLAMPQLPDQSPFATGNMVDSDTGASIRHTYGAVLGQNQLGTIYDAIWGKALVPDNSMAMIFPL